jgi:hypothetical protein
LNLVCEIPRTLNGWVFQCNARNCYMLYLQKHLVSGEQGVNSW